MVILIVVIALFAVLAATMVGVTFRFRSRQVAVAPAADLAVDGDAVAGRLSKAVSFQTDSQDNPEPFEKFCRFLQEAFPAVHQNLQWEAVNRFSRLYFWPGTDPALAPVVLMAHSDVVPIAEGTEADWTHPPFSGRIADGFIWGRGSLDDKGSLMGILEAVEALLAAGHVPRRGIYLAFGHDEETRTGAGAAQIAALLAARGVRAEFILDEGAVITRNMVPGVAVPVALVGIAEKGYLTLALEVTLQGGHAAMPPAQTAIGILCSAIDKLEKTPFPASYQGATKQMFDTLGPEMPFGLRFLFANGWLLKPVIIRALLKGNATNASLRTTTAVTVIRGGKVENVLPDKARALVNFRLLPGTSSDAVMERVRRVIADSRVSVRVCGNSKNEPSRISRTDSTGYRTVEKSIRQVFPDALVSPFLVQATTDTPYYSDISDTILRFFPVCLDPSDLSRIHGTDERIAVESMADGVRFYAQLIRNADERQAEV